MKYRVLCEVSGGVTGYRYAYLKNAGEEWLFDDYTAANETARELTLKMNKPNRTADFKYTPEPVDDSPYEPFFHDPDYAAPKEEA